MRIRNQESPLSTNDGQHDNRWRIIVWSVAALVLVLPALAMQFTEEVAWGLLDFVVFAAMLIVACGAYEVTSRLTHNNAYRAAVGVALATAFILIWINLAVGIIGTENNPENFIFVGVLGVAIVGAIIARLRPHGMAVALVATAIAQALVAAVTLMKGSGNILAVTGLFIVLWLTSAYLFRRAARQSVHPGS